MHWLVATVWDLWLWHQERGGCWYHCMCQGTDFTSITNIIIIIKQYILVIGCHDKNLIWQMQRTLSKHLAVTDTDVGIKHTHPDTHTHTNTFTHIYKHAHSLLWLHLLKMVCCVKKCTCKILQSTAVVCYAVLVPSYEWLTNISTRNLEMLMAENFQTLTMRRTFPSTDKTFKFSNIEYNSLLFFWCTSYSATSSLW